MTDQATTKKTTLTGEYELEYTTTRFSKKKPQEEKPEESKKPEKHKLHKPHYQYDRHYSLPILILLFFSVSFVGWLWEVSLHLVQDGVFVNRGVLFGPWLPIYGTGGIMALVLLKKTFHKPILTFFLIMVIASIVEYATSWYLEMTKGVRWWDYTNMPLNLNGRICLEGAVIFGLGGCALIYFLAPMLAGYYERMPIIIQIVLCVVLVGAFTADQIYSKEHPNVGEGITDYSEWENKG